MFYKNTFTAKLKYLKEWDNSMYRSGDENIPGSPWYDDGGYVDYLEKIEPDIEEYIRKDYGTCKILDLDIEGTTFVVKFKYIDREDGPPEVRTETLNIEDHEIGVDLDPDEY